MKQVKRKVLACLMAFVMSFSLMGGTALTALANDLTAGTIDDEPSVATQAGAVVYDTVYGVFGNGSGDYAVMMKTVTYEAQYGTVKNYQYRAMVADVVKSDGKVVVHTNDAPANHQSYVPGAATDYYLSTIQNAPKDLQAGYVKVTKKSTNKVGLYSLDKTQLIPCVYDSLMLMPSGDILGVALNGPTADAVIMNTKGTILFSFNFPAAVPQQYRYVYAQYSGDCIQVRVMVDGQEYLGYAKKTSSGYEQIDSSQYVPRQPVNYAYSNTFTNNSEYKLADGTVVTHTYASNNENMLAQYRYADGSTVVLGGRTLGTSNATGNYSGFSRSKHANADVWWAMDSNGRWGAVDSTGRTVIAFKYQAFYDGGEPNTNYALVKENGAWKFIKVAGSGVGKTYAINTTGNSQPASTIDNAGMDASKTWRAAGSDALDTMSRIIDKGNFPKGGTVVLATFDGYWDALAGAGIAGLTGAPVLMTYTNSLADSTAAQLKKLAPKTIIVCGGKAALTDKAANAAAKAAGGAKIVRLAGANAPDTAVKIYQHSNLWSDTAFVCTVEGYWDALAAAPISYAKHMPIFLTSSASTISPDTLKAMKQGGIKNVYIVGGKLAITPSVEKSIKNAGFTVKGRLAGNTAVETSEAVAAYGISLGMVANGVGVATVNGYWDALSGAALCGHLNSVLVLTADQTSHSVVSGGFLSAHSEEISDVNIFGGTAAISSATETAILASAK